VTSDLSEDPTRAVKLCVQGHARVLSTVQGLTEDQARSPSRLPGWTVGHVLSHLARNADGHARRLEGALRGEDVPRYPGGSGQRDREIDEGTGRPVAEIVADLGASQRRLESVWERSIAAGWPNSALRGSDAWPTTASPVRRLREVEVHHVDLGLGYEASDWPEEYVAWELPVILRTVPDRLRRADDARELVAWLAGRRPPPGAVELGPWCHPPRAPKGARTPETCHRSRPVTARLIPMPIMARPPAPPMVARRRGERDNHWLAVPAPTAQRLSSSRAMRGKSMPSRSS
jgi:maleylpyruvate isomerase